MLHGVLCLIASTGAIYHDFTFPFFKASDAFGISGQGLSHTSWKGRGFEELVLLALNLLPDHPLSPCFCSWKSANYLSLIILQAFITRNTATVITIPSLPQLSWYRSHYLLLLFYFILPCTFQVLLPFLTEKN